MRSFLFALIIFNLVLGTWVLSDDKDKKIINSEKPVIYGISETGKMGAEMMTRSAHESGLCAGPFADEDDAAEARKAMGKMIESNNGSVMVNRTETKSWDLISRSGDLSRAKAAAQIAEKVFEKGSVSLVEGAKKGTWHVLLGSYSNRGDADKALATAKTAGLGWVLIRENATTKGSYLRATPWNADWTTAQGTLEKWAKIRGAGVYLCNVKMEPES